MIEKTNLRDSYKYYRNNSTNPIDVKIYLYIVTGFIKFLMQKVFDGFDVHIGPGKTLGVIGIRGKKMIMKLDSEGNIVGLPTDYKKTNELWERDPIAKANRQHIFHFNEHTNGIVYGFKWWREGMNVANKRLYYLQFCKPNKRRMTVLAREGREYLLTFK